MNRLRFGYSLMATVVLAAMVLGGASKATSPTFDQITVRRINIIEPDGTQRMIISDRSAFPGMIVQGKEKPYKRPFAGMLLYNDEARRPGAWSSAGTRIQRAKWLIPASACRSTNTGHRSKSCSWRA